MTRLLVFIGVRPYKGLVLEVPGSLSFWIRKILGDFVKYESLGCWVAET